MEHFRLEALRKAVRAHLTEHGGRNWKRVTSRFADVPHATFWRTVKAVRAEGKSLKKSEEPPSDYSAVVGDTILFPASCDPLRKLAEYQGLIRSAQELIEQAKGPGGKIKNWQMHAKGVSLRESLVRNQVDVMNELAHLNTQTCFYQAVFELVDELAPDLRNQFVLRFRDLTKLRPEELQAATKRLRPKTG
jgi:hypothetical protein